MSEDYNKKTNENKIEGRNAVLEAFRSGKPVDKLFGTCYSGNNDSETNFVQTARDTSERCVSE